MRDHGRPDSSEHGNEVEAVFTAIDVGADAGDVAELHFDVKDLKGGYTARVAVKRGAPAVTPWGERLLMDEMSSH